MKNCEVEVLCSISSPSEL